MGEVDGLEFELYKKYGLTIRGLQAEYACDVEEFLEAVHGALDIENILKSDVDMVAMLSRAKRKPFVYTNSDETHARRCLDVLGLSRHFADVFFVDPSKDGYICKPDVAAFEEVEAAIRAAGPGLCPAGATLGSHRRLDLQLQRGGGC